MKSGFVNLNIGLARLLKDQRPAVKVLIVAAADLLMLSCIVMLAYALRLSSFDLPPWNALHLYLVSPFLSVTLAFLFSVYSASGRHFTFSLERRLVVSQLFVPIVWAMLLFAFGTTGFARSTIIIYCIMSIGGMIVIRRLAARFMMADQVPRQRDRNLIPMLIYGSGQEGIAVLEAVRRQGRYKPVAFIDTDYTLVDRMIAGIRVFPTESLEQVVARFQPKEVIIAKPTQNRANKRAVVDTFLGLGLAVKVVPGVDEIVDGRIDISDLRQVNVEDLLGRDPVPPDAGLMAKAVRNQVVMVSGAGGSIGSELVRQACAHGAQMLVMVDSSEFALFEIHREMERQIEDTKAKTTLVPLLADVRDKQRMKAIASQYGIEIIFHAAAYKHVRMVQDNAVAGVDNNVFGTRSLAEAATESGVKRFVLISTDKAVRPTSVMGASKRVAEMVIQAMAARNEGRQKNGTIFSIVRFGNVLGSTGSVVPLFREQIVKGGPLTVTHPDVTRYFMLIPEAAQLVIQASAMAKGGEVFVLDMGEPIKILQLAETMIELAGMTRRTEENPAGDIEINFVGLKDGEKLYEELQIGEDVTPTSHPRIVQSHEVYLPTAQLNRSLAALMALAEKAKQRDFKDKLLQLASTGA